MKRLLISHRFSTAAKALDEKWRNQVLNYYPPVRSAEKQYVLAQFPYPSGNLHMGHVRVYAIADALARIKRLKGFKVLHPLGWDAFGLPAENAARERGIEPGEWTQANISQMKQQLIALGIQIPWDKCEINTSNPAFYKWTRWIFARLFKKGLAYRKEAEVNWDPKDQTVLADEQVSPEGTAWRSGALVERKSLPQWFLRITQYSPELLESLNNLPEWPEGVKEMQRNWIPQMRDWLISRQRRWGTPIPILHCRECGPVLTIDDHGNDVSCSSESECPQCGNSQDNYRETDTMDTFVDSSWYFLRFLDPHNASSAFATQRVKEWMPVDFYVGGVEHSILHLLYSRFIHKFLMDDLGMRDGPREPFKRLLCQGLVMGKTFKCPDTLAYLKPEERETISAIKTVVRNSGKEALVSWEKMSKSKYNGVDPSILLYQNGADCLRLAVLFKAPIENHLYWDEQDVVGISRWMNRLLGMRTDRHSTPTSRRALSRARGQVLRDLEKFQFHTAIAALMKLSNELDVIGGFDKESLEQFAIMLHPLAPHLASELYSKTGRSWGEAIWPSLIEPAEQCKIGFYKVQLDGKVIGEINALEDKDQLVRDALSKFAIDPTVQVKLLQQKSLLSFSSRTKRINPTKAIN